MVRQFHFDFPSEPEARLAVHLIVRRLREDVAVCRIGRSVIVVDGSGHDRREELLSITTRAE